MSDIKLSLKHNRTREEAKKQLETVVHQIQSRFGSMVQRFDWSADRDAIRMYGTGFEAEIRVDDQEVHVTADVPFLSGLLGSPFAAGLKGIVEQSFHKRLK